LLASLRAYATSVSTLFGGVGLEFSSSNLTFHISLLDISTLNPHEEVVESTVESLADAMRTQRVVRDPLIIDQKDRVILDGTHRHRSLERLKCRFAPCCLVDYDNPLIKLSSWFRLFTIDEPEPLAQRLLAESKLNCKKQRIDVAGLSSASDYVFLTSNGIAYSYPRDSDAMERARIAVGFERALTMRGHHVDYLSEKVALQNLKSGSVDFIIAVPVFTKHQISEFGVRRLLLPHKTTRHEIPSRPLRIDIPLDMLRNENVSQAEADQLLQELLSTKRTERKPPGSVVDGRRYEEELLVFAG
jgi:hypothetical protein